MLPWLRPRLALPCPAHARPTPHLQLGIPVRVTRKQKDPHGHYGCCYLYDGLVRAGRQTGQSIAC